MHKTLDDYLALPYAIELIPDEDDQKPSGAFGKFRRPMV